VGLLLGVDDDSDVEVVALVVAVTLERLLLLRRKAAVVMMLGELTNEAAVAVLTVAAGTKERRTRIIDASTSRRFIATRSHRGVPSPPVGIWRRIVAVAVLVVVGAVFISIRVMEGDGWGWCNRSKKILALLGAYEPTHAEVFWCQDSNSLG